MPPAASTAPDRRCRRRTPCPNRTRPICATQARLSCRCVSRKKHHARQTALNVSTMRNQCHAAAGAPVSAARRPCSAVVPHQPVDDEERSVQAAPQHERPARAVPQPAEQHGDHQRGGDTQGPAAVAAERDVEIVAQEPRQRHVPAPPEILDRGGEVRPVEILRPAEAEPQAEPARDVGVAGEIEIDLQRVEIDVRQSPTRRRSMDPTRARRTDRSPPRCCRPAPAS